MEVRDDVLLGVPVRVQEGVVWVRRKAVVVLRVVVGDGVVVVVVLVLNLTLRLRQPLLPDGN